MDPPLDFDYLCPECVSLFALNPPHSTLFGGSTSHLTIADLRASSERGCHLCCLLLNSFLAQWKRANDIHEGFAGPPEDFEQAGIIIHFIRLDRRQVRLRAALGYMPSFGNQGKQLGFSYSTSLLAEFDITPLVSFVFSNLGELETEN